MKSFKENKWSKLFIGDLTCLSEYNYLEEEKLGAVCVCIYVCACQIYVSVGVGKYIWCKKQKQNVEKKKICMGMCIYSICMIVFQGFILLGYILEAIEINDKPIDETKQNKTK